MIFWTCHVCGEERPDERISVYTTEVRFGPVTAQRNIRYCNDRPACLRGARQKGDERDR